MKMVAVADETVVGGGESVGARLRRAREAHGLSLDDIGARTRVPTRHLKAIEEDAFDQLPAAPYSVGFAKAFADAVGLNREEIGREFRAEKEGYGAAEAPPPYATVAPVSAGSGRILWMLLILLVIAGAGYGAWRSGIFGGSSPFATPVAAPLPPAPPAPAQAAVAPETAAPAKEDEASASPPASSEPSQGDEKKGEATASKSEGRSDEAKDSFRNATSSEVKSSEAKSSGTSRKSEEGTTRQLNVGVRGTQTQATPEASTTSATPAAPPILTPPPPPPPSPSPSLAPAAAPTSTTP
jgi:transcriptional regulator with XRE-family HTH domain